MWVIDEDESGRQMVKALILTDGQPYTKRYVETLLAEGHEVYVQVAPGVTQTTAGISQTIDLFDLASVYQAMAQMDFVVIIGEPIHSYTALTQANEHDRAQLVYENIAVALQQSNVAQVLVIQAKPSPILMETFKAYGVPVSYEKRQTTRWQRGKHVLAHVAQDVHSVRSIQSLNIPEGISMEGALSLYGRFLRTLHGRLINGVYDGEYFTIVLKPFNIPLIKMQHAKYSERMTGVIMDITGGLLVGPSARQPRFEIRRLGKDTTQCIIGLHDFVPSLPWGLYRLIQAPLHVAVSHLFRKYWEKF